MHVSGLGFPAAVRTLMGATVFTYLAQVIVDNRTGGVFTGIFGLSRDAVAHGYFWQPLSYMFLHDGRQLWHILMNMVGLAFFGREVEWAIGSRRMTGLYLGGGVLGGLAWLLISGRTAVCVGASGAVFGLLGAFAAMFPHREITLLLFFVLPVTMTARTLAIVLGGIALLALMTGGGGVAHAAHLAGGIAGYLYGHHRAGAGGPWFVFGGGGWKRLALRWPEAWRPRGPPSREEVDRILDKINREGIGSLSRRERSALERASRRHPTGS
jgi:membrane associated rhomboid family serine protease